MSRCCAEVLIGPPPSGAPGPASTAGEASGLLVVEPPVAPPPVPPPWPPITLLPPWPAAAPPLPPLAPPCPAVWPAPPAPPAVAPPAAALPGPLTDDVHAPARTQSART